MAFTFSGSGPLAWSVGRWRQHSAPRGAVTVPAGRTEGRLRARRKAQSCLTEHGGAGSGGNVRRQGFGERTEFKIDFLRLRKILYLVTHLRVNSGLALNCRIYEWDSKITRTKLCCGLYVHAGVCTAAFSPLKGQLCHLPSFLNTLPCQKAGACLHGHVQRLPRSPLCGHTAACLTSPDTGHLIRQQIFTFKRNTGPDIFPLRWVFWNRGHCWLWRTLRFVQGGRRACTCGGRAMAHSCPVHTFPHLRTNCCSCGGWADSTVCLSPPSASQALLMNLYGRRPQNTAYALYIHWDCPKKKFLNRN